jgi:hypothetical protein
MSAQVLNDFGLNEFVAANRVQVGRLQGFGQLGAVSDISAEAGIDVAIAVGETRVLMALVAELAKVNHKLYQQRVQHVEHMIAAVSELNQQIAGLTTSNIATWRTQLEHVNSEMADLEQQLHRDLAASRTKRDILAVGLTAGAMLLAGASGWSVFMRRRKRN